VFLLTLILGCDTEPTVPAEAPAEAPAEVAEATPPARERPTDVPIKLPTAPLSPELQAIADQLVAKEYEATRTALDAWLAEHPDDADALYLRGESFMAELNWPEADAAFAKAIAASPDYADARKRQLGALIGQRKCAEVSEGIIAYQALRPDDPEPLVMRSFCRGAQGDHEGALADVVLACEQGYADACQLIPRLEGRLAWVQKKEAERAEAGSVIEDALALPKPPEAPPQ
jgi:tetratricopeptide (TPR) repeat protein